MCAASDECKVIFVVFECNKRHYKNNIYVRKSNSTFIETSSGRPYTIESTPLCISPEEIVFFQSTKVSQSTEKRVTRSSSQKQGSLSSLFINKDEF